MAPCHRHSRKSCLDPQRLPKVSYFTHFLKRQTCMKRALWRQLAVLLAIAFAFRLAAGWQWQSRLDGRFGMGDTWATGPSAKKSPTGSRTNLAKTTTECSARRAIRYCWRRFSGWPAMGRAAVMLARAEAALLATLSVLAVWWLARILFDDRAALLAAALATFYPGAIALGALILSEAPFCPLMLLQLVFWMLAWNASSSVGGASWASAPD